MTETNRPANPARKLLISDCDDVLLHFVGPFSQWLEEDQNIRFDFGHADFSRALIDGQSGKPVLPERIWELLNAFFDTQMHRQFPFDGAVDALLTIAKQADVVILTNLLDHRQETRTRQLQQYGLDFPVYCNQGPKGDALKRIIDEYQPDMAVFIDDLPQHHQSASETAPDCWRLHMVGDPRIGAHIGNAYERGHAHARIDDWASALPWLLEIFEKGEPAPPLKAKDEAFSDDLLKPGKVGGA